MLRCRLLGHRFRFSSVDEVMAWRCLRDCGANGRKGYESAERAAVYANAFNREDRASLGNRAPLVGLFPLRLYRVLRDRRQRR